jgi:DNA-binding XRE family transcriptional regulator
MVNQKENRNELREILRGELPVLRAKAKVSQEDISKMLGISRQTYNSYETGKRIIPMVTLLALIAFFQNNENTKNMLFSIEGLKEKLRYMISNQTKER